jgi:ABC-type nitrate/sulfonate/bicarbonate transport system substrate-binding protein
MTRSMRRALTLSVVILLGSVDIQASNSREVVRVMAFPGAFNWPIWAGMELGFFEAEGISVELDYTSSSKQQFLAVMNGEQDIIMTAIDNVVAYRDHFGEAALPEPSDVVTFMGGDNGFLSLVAQPRVTSYDDLVGTRLAVDAMTTGYAFVLRKLIQKGGVSEDNVEYVSVGGALQRFRAMMQGEYSASVLMTPFDLMADQQGFNVLDAASDVVGEYQGVVGATREVWALENEASLVAYIRAYRQSLNWLYDRSNKAAALSQLRVYLPQIPESVHEAIYNTILADETGLDRHAALNHDGLKTVLSLREEFGPDGFTPGSIDRYYISTYFDLALAGGALSERSMVP